MRTAACLARYGKATAAGVQVGAGVGVVGGHGLGSGGFGVVCVDPTLARPRLSVPEAGP